MLEVTRRTLADELQQQLQQRFWRYRERNRPNFQFPENSPSTPFPERRSVTANTATTSDSLPRRVPTTPFPDRRSIPIEESGPQTSSPQTPFPDRRSVPFERCEVQHPQRPVTPSTSSCDHSSSPTASSPPCPTTPPPDSAPASAYGPSLGFSTDSSSTSASGRARKSAVHTQLHLVDFGADASIDKLRRGRVVPLHLGRAARHIVLVRVAADFDLFPECGLLLTIDPPDGYCMEIVIAIEVVDDWDEADAEVASLVSIANSDSACAGKHLGHYYDCSYGASLSRDNAYGSELTDFGPQPAWSDLSDHKGSRPDAGPRIDTAAGATFASARTAQTKRLEVISHDEAEVHLVPLPGPGFANWLLASLADALEFDPGLHVTFAAVETWDSAWIRPHWAGAIVEDLLAMTRQQASETSTMMIHLYSGIKQAGKSQHDWDKARVAQVRRERVAWLDESGWWRLKRGLGSL